MAAAEAFNVVTSAASTPAVAEAVTQGYYGLLAVGAGLIMAGACIGTGMAQGPIGAAAFGAVAEDKKNIGMGLFFMAIPETILIIGAGMAFMLIGKIVG